MNNILLLEPDYKNKYPPIGLMKISYYHKKIRNDKVFFSKGKIKNESYKEINWDRIYITTLFTFEWKKTIEMINYAKEIVKDKDKIYIGGILASLMSDEIEKETGIKPITGQLNENGKIGYDDDGIIDNLPLDYDILNDIEYKYRMADAYITYATRGCPMGCEFCAVKDLEPKYNHYISFKENIEKINQEYGSKRNLLLMDNNVLVSQKFNEIIEEIKKIGFKKGEKYKSPKTGRMIKRYIDFNQGLDANLITPEKALKLSEIEIEPIRIAFDHISGKENYLKAMKICIENNLKSFSNYILYNSEEFKGKGVHLSADKPEELYERLKINVEFKKEILEKTGEKIKIYSFPMKYIPLTAKDRRFIGTNWNKKYLRAIQVILIPTMGKGVSSEGFFYTAFGKNKEEFFEILRMPEKLIMARGNFLKRRKKSDRNTFVFFEKKILWEKQQNNIREWKKLDAKIKDKTLILNYVSDNQFNYKKYLMIKEENIKKIYLHYLSETQLIFLIKEIRNKKLKEEMEFLKEYDLEFRIENFFHKKLENVKNDLKELLGEYYFESKLSYFQKFEEIEIESEIF